MCPVAIRIKSQTPVRTIHSANGSFLYIPILTRMSFYLKQALYIATAAGSVLSALASEPIDTLATQQLGEVIVTAVKPASETIPVQTLSGKELNRLNSNSVADALRYFAGVQVKDYGGVGGIKTVNIRSMGTNHTGVVYDGVQLGNAQNGQIDLGQFSLDNIEALSLHNGQKSALLQPARDFGNAGTIYLRTRTPRFEDGETYHARLSMRCGSFY